MKIHVTSDFVPNGHRIARELAGRLGLDFYGVSDLIRLPLISYNEDTQAIKEFWETHNDCAVYSQWLGDVDDSDAYKVHLYGSLYAETATPEVLREHHNLIKTFRERNCPESVYDVEIYVTGVPIEKIVQRIIDCLVAGRGGDFMPVEALLPKALPDYVDTDWDAYIPKNLTYKVKSFYNAYILENNTQYAAMESLRGNLIRVEVEECDEVTPLFYADYMKWQKLIGGNSHIAILSIMLAKYCAKYQLFDPEEAFCALSKNGIAYNKLYELGFGD